MCSGLWTWTQISPLTSAMLKSNRKVLTLSFSVAHLSLCTDTTPEWYPMRCQNDLPQFLFYSSKWSVKSMKKLLSLSRILTENVFSMLILSAFGSFCQKREGHTCSQLLQALPGDQEVMFLFEEPAENDSVTASSAKWDWRETSNEMSHLGSIPWAAPRRKVCQQNAQPCPLTLAPVPARRTLGCVTGWSIHGDFMLNHCWEPVTLIWKVPLTHWWQQCPISPWDQWLLPFAQADSFWGDGEWPSPFQPCWWTASWIFHAVAGCRLLTEITQLTWWQPWLFVQDGSLQAAGLLMAWQESPKPGHTVLRNAASQPSLLHRLNFYF